MKVLVSGGTGFLGEAITRELLKREGHIVTVLGRDAKRAKEIFPNEPVRIIEGDITKPETLRKAVEGIEVIVQCAQFPGHPVENKQKGYTYWAVDGAGTENLAKAGKEAGVEHIIYLSGAGTNGKKSEPWFRAKWYAEQAIHGTGIRATILRPSWVYGPKDKSLNRIMESIRLFPLCPLIGGGKNSVQPIFVEDLAKIVALCISNQDRRDHCFDVGGPKEMSVREMLKTVMKVMGKNRFFLPIPKSVMKLGASFLQFLPNPPLNRNAVDFITMDTRIDVTPLLNAFPSMQLTNLEDGLKRYLGGRLAS